MRKLPTVCISTVAIAPFVAGCGEYTDHTVSTEDAVAQVCVDPNTGKRVDDANCSGNTTPTATVAGFRMVCADIDEKKQVGTDLCKPTKIAEQTKLHYGFLCMRESDLSFVDDSQCKPSGGSVVPTTVTTIVNGQPQQVIREYHTSGSSLTPFVWYYLGTRAGGGSLLPSIGQSVGDSDDYRVTKTKPKDAKAIPVPKTGGTFSDSIMKSRSGKSFSFSFGRSGSSDGSSSSGSSDRSRFFGNSRSSSGSKFGGSSGKSSSRSGGFGGGRSSGGRSGG